jgi:hypothetical protein
MTHGSEKQGRLVLVGAGVTNLVGVPLFSQMFSNDMLIALNPGVFSRFGLLLIMFWGLAYLASAGIHRQASGLLAVFALVKLVYVVTWGLWLNDHLLQLPELLRTHPLTGAFYAVYGVIDLLFAVLFLRLSLQARQASMM